MPEPDLNQALDGLLGAFTEFKGDYDKRLTSYNERPSHLEKVAGRAPVWGLSNAKGTDLQLERKALGNFVKTGAEAELKAVASLATDNDPAGGYVVLPHMAATMIKQLSHLPEPAGAA